MKKQILLLEIWLSAEQSVEMKPGSSVGNDCNLM